MTSARKQALTEKVKGCDMEKHYLVESRGALGAKEIECRVLRTKRRKSFRQDGIASKASDSPTRQDLGFQRGA